MHNAISGTTDTNGFAALGAEVPGHRQEQLSQILIVPNIGRGEGQCSTLGLPFPPPLYVQLLILEVRKSRLYLKTCRHESPHSDPGK